ncbi:hypothetical protein LCGC14_0811470 [marine sediment metagenome]|uniref:Phage protein Gp37/Gp68 n=1 Tax=marine sediment metagenome TaxID=412755 RepID=A0A0F9S6J2_9ZZZZ
MPSKIEWTDETWNPVAGCTRVSPGCQHCYAERMAKRQIAMGNKNYEGTVDKHGRWTGKINLIPDALEKPLRWCKPRRVFVNSMSDLFHEDVPDEFIGKVFAVMGDWKCSGHTFQILTKRPERMCQIVLKHIIKPFPNVHLGVSVENQATANERIPWLLKTPAAVRWISLEPMLGPVDLRPWLGPEIFCELCDVACPECPYEKAVVCDEDICDETGYLAPRTLDSIVVGGESGPGARPMHPDWPRSVRDQCQEAGIAFFFKQWGAWGPNQSFDHGLGRKNEKEHYFDSRNRVYRVGKKSAGRILDGRTWDELPAQGKVADG